MTRTTESQLFVLACAVLCLAVLATGTAAAADGRATVDNESVDRTYEVSAIVTDNTRLAYTIDGEVRPSLTLVENQTYAFELDSSVDGHPLHLTTDAGGGREEFPSDQVTQGVNVTDPYQGTNEHAAEQGTVYVTVPEGGFDALGLYYQCGVHQNMGAGITTAETPQVATLPDGTSPPTSTDGDPLLEDVDGDGSAGLFDALTYYNNRRSPLITENPIAFDFDGDGQAGTLFDALALYNDIQ